jgi:hypothetical protein
MDRESVIARLTEALGEPTSRTEYVCRWALHPDLDIAAEARPGRDGVVRMPWTSVPASALPFARYRSPDDRTNSNVYDKSPSLASGHLFEARVSTAAELDMLVGYILGRLDAVRR